MTAVVRDRPRPRPARLAPADVFGLGVSGLRSRPLRVVLSALGIAIGIAAMVCVVGISTSSREELNRRLATLGTNLLTVETGQSFGGDARLPAESVAMIGAIGPVESVSAIGETDAKVYRNDRIGAEHTGGIGVYAARTDLPATVGAEVVAGRWLDEASAGYPVTVLGPEAAAVLGVHSVGVDVQVWLGGRWFTVAGILAPNELAPELDTAALVGWPEAAAQLGFDGRPTTIYTRAEKEAVADVQAVLGATANPEEPSAVTVSRPSDALAAGRAADETLGALLLALGAVSLLVGGVGVANTMVISVLERRAEIGLRRSLGATRPQIRVQFLVESQLLSLLGGVAGVLIGVVVTFGYATAQGWPGVVPAWAVLAAVASTLGIGAIAGLYPAIRASRLPPTEALSSA
ncbi:putative ABC transport system permease protein [Actinocorallia herbida]|uniref:Putative ABC transport system permease protein n=1 Tax=Actinocorallia herbida TaxID=58109 RepID=A0A3N1CZI6_9ACTN|nr:ABC transporter permease [Actinocorallia herbida]ROO86700.1 putative ABC transport system permease protein [Actinocorallia herbida]